MAHYNDTARIAAGVGLIDTVRDIIEGMRSSIARQRAFAKTYNELNALSDHELADIGLGRSDIMDIARSTAARL
ncbi:DUF1127 domain-containing protein [Celeribacter sp. PS-C1]|uniref:DUF1127 domain-containing protein n=1 Tax=Celeribacter sp. PS-C1 TaxID=2820813 RepID=UPI001CA4D265|nr:DUF1127 domain-containing protein [Celeribacter sp. PS-C1]MBW6418735.1 DUF1127 domain-containing protein [Celeribacter sp. PS-C1]